MKVPDSGMPEEAYWESLLDVSFILDRLGIDRAVANVAELGCGYGTFTIPVAERVTGTVFTFDVEAPMIERTMARVKATGLDNIKAELRDILMNGFGLPTGSCDACLLFNILHCPEPIGVMREAARVVRPGGRVLIIHWRSDIRTPRGPSLDVRPRSEQVKNWAHDLELKSSEAVELPPWHYGMSLTK